MFSGPQEKAMRITLLLFALAALAIGGTQLSAQDAKPERKADAETDKVDRMKARIQKLRKEIQRRSEMDKRQGPRAENGRRDMREGKRMRQGKREGMRPGERMRQGKREGMRPGKRAKQGERKDFRPGKRILKRKAMRKFLKRCRR
jgi:hypothetical protein